MENLKATATNRDIKRYGHGGVKVQAVTKAVYVQNPEDWKALTDYADAHEMSVSEVIFSALALLIDNKCKTCERIAEVLATGSVKAKAKAKK